MRATLLRPPVARRAIATEVATLPSSATIGWLRVSSKPLKQTLATWASKWAYVFIKYLQDKARGPAAGGPAACRMGCPLAVGQGQQWRVLAGRLASE